MQLIDRIGLGTDLVQITQKSPKDTTPLLLEHKINRKKLPREHLTGCQGLKMF